MSNPFKNTPKIIWPFAAAFILYITIFQYLPLFVQDIIHHTVAKKNLPISLKVRDIGLWGSDFSELSVGSGTPFAKVDSIRVDYSPTSLWQKKLKRISLSGVELNLHFQDGQLSVPWQSAQEEHNEDYHLDYLNNLGEISIDQAVINISSGNKHLSITCHINVQISEANPRLILIRADLMLRGQKVTATAGIDLDSQEMRTNIAANSVNLIRFADLFKVYNDLSVAGWLGFRAETHLSLNPPRLISAELSGKLDQTDITFREVTIRNIDNQSEKPFLFNLTAENNKVRLNSSTFLAMAGLLDAEIGGFTLSLSKLENDFSFEGEFTVNIPEQASGAPFAIEPLALVTAVHGETEKAGGWHFRATASNKNTPLRISQAELNLSSQITAYTLEGSGKADQTTLAYSLNLAPVNIESDGISIQLPELVVRGQSINGKNKFVLPFENFSFMAHKANISGIAKGEIIFNWPHQPGPETGKISIKNIMLADMDLGNLSLSLRQEQLGFEIEGRHQSALLDNFCLELTGLVDFSAASPKAEIQFKNACVTSFTNLDLGRFAPKAAGYEAGAELNLEGNIIYQDGRLSGKIDTKIENIRLASIERDFILEGGELAVHFAELPKIKTGPKQQFSFEHLRLGKISVENGLVEFQIESPESIFIEKSEVQWSDGHVYTQALRFSPKIKDYDLIFYCDRLHFAKLLEQLGVAAAEGQGRVNGRIPIRITDGKFFLENGFLYSTPGEGGTIKLTETDLLKVDIPKNTPQFAQIDLASEALKDFSYDWTRLDINSESAEDLLIHLQINGKPTEPLPFVYSKEFGGFARVKASSPGSRFQGIKLDVNFRLPLNKLLSYGDTIKSLIE